MSRRIGSLAALVALATLLVLLPAGRAHALTVANGKVYWVKDTPLKGKSGVIGRANVDGTGVRQNFIRGLAKKPGESGNGALAVSGSHIYWAIDSVSGRNRGRIGRARLNGKHVRHGFVKRVQPGSLAAFGNYVYWTNFIDYTPRPRGTSIGRVRRSGRSLGRHFIKAGPSARIGAGIAVDHTGIYWGGGRGSDYQPSISRASLKGTEVKRLFHPDQGRPFDTEEGSLYYLVSETFTPSGPRTSFNYTSTDPGSPFGGGGDRLLELDTIQLGSVSCAVDNGYLYWIEQLRKGTRIMRAKISRGQFGSQQTLGPRQKVLFLRHSFRFDIN